MLKTAQSIKLVTEGDIESAFFPSPLALVATGKVYLTQSP